MSTGVATRGLALFTSSLVGDHISSSSYFLKLISQNFVATEPPAAISMPRLQPSAAYDTVGTVGTTQHSSVRWHRSIRYLLVASFLVNVIGLGTLANVIQGRGGMSYLKARIHKHPYASVEDGSINRERIFETLPEPKGRPIVFLGDSLTAAYEWSEAFGHRHTILNRGIGGDTTTGVLNRISTITKLKPKAVFLMIGTNDQLHGYVPADTVHNYRSIVAALLESSPDIQIYEESILPTREPEFNIWATAMNKSIRGIADGKSIIFLDLETGFLDENQLLDKRYTWDGLHLSADGYLRWMQRINPVIDQLSIPDPSAL